MDQEHAIYIGNNSKWIVNSIHKYVEACQLYNIFGEITRVVLRKSNIGPSQAINEYLQQCSKGQHVLLKSFGSFCKCTLNRLCFLSSFVKIFELDTHTRNGLDYYQLFRLLCSDFPKDIVSKCVYLLHSESQDNMSVLLNSKNFINALYLFLIYTDFCETIYTNLFQSQKKQRSFVQIFEWLKQWDKKHIQIYQKPKLSTLIQVLLRLMRKYNLLGTYCKVIFLTEDTITQYINQKFKNQGTQKCMISYLVFMKQLLESPEHLQLVQKSLSMFDNANNWSNQALKILSAKENGDIYPLNSKKAKLKK